MVNRSRDAKGVGGELPDGGEPIFPTALTWSRSGSGTDSLHSLQRTVPVEVGAVINGRYRVEELIGQGGMGVVYRVGDQLHPGRPTALKTLLHQVRAHHVDLFRTEFKTMASLRHPNIAQVYDFERIVGQEAFFFTMELVQGKPLSQKIELRDEGESVTATHQPTAFSSNLPDIERGRGGLRSSRLPWPEVVDLLVAVARALSYLHKRGVVHFDLKPSNIVVGPGDHGNDVKVLDFGLAGLKRESAALMGTPIYLAPETAARLQADHRADLYSLGVMAFQLLCGETPHDTTGGFHKLLQEKRTQPVRFTEAHSQAVPEWLQRVVEKLCAIDPADRFPTAAALLDTINQVGGFDYELETEETRESYLSSSTFVGRRQEMSLLQGFVDERLDGGGSGVLFVTGKSGMGKSRLMRELRHSVQLSGVPFVEADCFERDLAEFAPIAALVLQTVSLAKAAEVQRLLPEYGPEMVKLVPALGQDENLTPTQALENPDAERRRMLEATAQFFVELGQSVPYVLYVNDLQWARDGTVDLLAAISRRISATDGKKSSAAVLGSYRSDEVTGRPIEAFLTGASVSPRRIELAPLEEAEVIEFVQSMLGLTELPPGFGRRVTRSSTGLPFFVEEILRDLLEDGKIQLLHGDWTAARGMVEKDLEFDAAASFLKRAARVTTEERRVLDALAVSGRPANLKILERVTELDTSAMRDGLRVLSDRQMVIAVAAKEERYGLAHDRMREALYGSLETTTCSELHLSFARTLAEGLTESDQGELLFQTLGHFEQARSLVTNTAERSGVAALHLRAALATNATGAFTTGAVHLERAKQLLPERAWDRNYVLMLTIEQTLALTLITLGRISESREAADSVVVNARTVFDEAPGWEARILCHNARDEYEKAIGAGIEICGKLGMSLPRKPNTVGILWHMGRCLWHLRGRSDDDLAALPPVRNPTAVRLVRIMTSMTASCYVTEPNLWPIMICQSLMLMLKHGHGPTHSLLFAWFGTALNAVGAYRMADRFARLSIRLIDSPNGVAFRPKVHHALGQFLLHWTEPLTQSVDWCRSGVERGQRVEDTEYAGYCYMGWAKASFEAGEPLSQVHATSVAALETLQGSGQKGTEAMHLPGLQAVENLLVSGGNEPWLLNGAYYDDDAREKGGLSNAQDGFRLLEKCRLACFFRQRAGIELGAELIRVVNVGLPATFYFSIARYLACLCWLHECHTGGSWWQRRRCLRKVGRAQKQLRKWAAICPESFAHRYLLVEAERLRAVKNRSSAAKVYNDAIATASRNGFVQDCALANELAAEFHLGAPDENRARGHLRAALDGYRQWQAVAKVEDLRRRYARFDL